MGIDSKEGSPVVKASFLSRFFAWFLDGVIMGILAFVLALIIGLIAGLGASTESSILGFLSGVLILVMIIVLFLFQFVYFGYFWGKDGQTLGMKMLNMKVVRRNGEDLSFWRAAFRGTIGYWISALIFYLGYIWAAFDSEQEAWHDKIFDTWVVET
jgi:uncharacterized RDD family membrane protein YckC